MTQNKDEYKTFSENLELSIGYVADKNPYMMVFVGDFNAKYNLWYADDNKSIEE